MCVKGYRCRRRLAVQRIQIEPRLHTHVESVRTIGRVGTGTHEIEGVVISHTKPFWSIALTRGPTGCSPHWSAGVTGCGVLD